jgi:hypothetical protein
MRFLNVLNALLNSRKAVAALTFLIVGGTILLGYHNVTPETVMSYLVAAGLVIGVLINAIKDEDVAAKHAASVIQAAQMTAAATASQAVQPTVGINTQTVDVSVQEPKLP